MRSTGKPRWQHVTALVSLSAGGTITGFSFVPRAAADLASPTGLPIRVLALEHAARPAPAGDSLLRSAIVNVAHYYLRMAEHRTSAEMEEIIWRHASADGVNHGASCAAFASLTLELAAQVVGQQSWETGGTSYPWPLHEWADVRVDPNPASPGIISILQDAEAHHRWHPLGDGYMPLPGDWVLFNGHIEVVTKYLGGVLHTIGGDSLPNFSVNAHEYRNPLSAQGVVGFVNNGELPGSANRALRSDERGPGGHRARGQATSGLAAIPGVQAADSAQRAPARTRAGGPATSPRAAAPGGAAIPGLSVTADEVSVGSASLGSASPSLTRYRRHEPSPPMATVHDANAQQAFIGEVAPAAVATQRRYGVPASVTIAQAIDESGWGRSNLATRDHNLFGIKGTGPAGSVPLPTQEYENGQLVTQSASFRVYRDITESIDDHGRLLATSGYYQQAMAKHEDPDAFATALTGVYATDPKYGAKLIKLMRQYHLYRYDVVATTASPDAAAPGGASIPGLSTPTPAPTLSTSPPAPSPGPTPRPRRQSNPDRPPSDRPPSDRPASKARPSTQTVSAQRMPPIGRTRRTASRNSSADARPYQHHIPLSVGNSIMATARVPLLRAEPLYRDVASHSGIRWELLAACDWMQCEAKPRYSPVHGERLGTANRDGTTYRTKSAALEQCAEDLVELARTVYRIDLAARGDLSVRDLANVFAAFRWGGLLKLHRTSAMEFPYSVAGLTVRHLNMRWPNIAESNTPDKPGSRFRRPFGAVPIVLSLNYPATV